MYKEDAKDQEEFDVDLFVMLMSNEVDLLKKVPSHPNIIKLIEFNDSGKLVRSSGREADVLYCVLEFAPGGDLFDYIFAVGEGFPEPVARFYFKQLFSAIEFLHQNEIVHRDMKLENLLLDGQYNLKVADFGLSTSVESELDSGVMYTRVGTERYMPPEMIEKEVYIGTYADLFAVGVICFAMVLGIMPTRRRADSTDELY